MGKIVHHRIAVNCKKCHAEHSRELNEGEGRSAFKGELYKLGWVVVDDLWVCPKCVERMRGEHAEQGQP